MWARTCCSGSTTARQDASSSASAPARRRPAGRARSGPRRRWVTVAFTYHGLKALACRRIRWTASRPSSSEGMAARAAELGDVGESAPNTGSRRSERRRARGAGGALARCRRGLRRCAERAGAAQRAAAGRRGDLAAGLLPAPDRTDVVRLQGRHRPARDRGQRHPAREPAWSGRSRPASSSSATRTRPGQLPPMPTPAVLGRNGTYVVFRKLHTRVAAYRQYLARRRHARGGGAARREDGRALAERGAARARTRRGRPRARRGRRPQQRLPLRRRSARVQVPGRRARAPREPAGRVRWRGQRQRAPPPHDPAGDELRADAA